MATIHLTIPDYTLKNMLRTAAEGGSTNWARFTLPKDSSDYSAVRVQEIAAHSAAPPVDCIVTIADLATGLQRLSTAEFPSALQHLANVITENSDNMTADVVLQMAVFGYIAW
jgi:hypothetical protein